MDINTLKALGLSPEELGQRLVSQAVDVLLYTTGFDPQTEEESRYDAKFKREIEARVQQAVDFKIAALAEAHILPKIGEMVERANLRATNQWGEPKGEAMSFIEYLASRADAYMSEQVNDAGQSKAEAKDSYWRPSGSRVTVLMKLYIQDHLNRAAQAAVKDVNKAVAQGIEAAAVTAIRNAADAISKAAK